MQFLKATRNKTGPGEALGLRRGAMPQYTWFDFHCGKDRKHWLLFWLQVSSLELGRTSLHALTRLLITCNMSTMHTLSSDFPRQRLPYHRFSGKKLDRRASFGLSAQFGVCFLSSGTPVRPLRLTGPTAYKKCSLFYLARTSLTLDHERIWR
jgi:hypothetical protein